MMALLVVPLLVAVLAAGCGGSAGSGEGSPGQIGGPPGEEDEGIARQDTPHGEAAIELVVEPRDIRMGEQVSIRLVSRGEVEVLTGLGFSVERWDGQRWVDVPWPEDLVFPAIGIVLPPGGSVDPQRWPTERVRVEPGWYRAVKSATYEDPEHVRPDTKLEARTRFRVRGNG
jgi:hypothetical protein